MHIMIESLSLLLAIASFSPAAERPHFADDFPPGSGYVAVLEVLPDEDGMAKTCELNSVREASGETAPARVSPSDAFVLDACRKLHTAKWQVKRDATGAIEAQLYFCRYVESFPDSAFCDRQLGD
jgi:hypothetical protein